MQYLHTMLRIRDIDASLRFYCDILGMQEVKRYDNEAGRFTLLFLAAPQDIARALDDSAPLLELTYNWPDENGEVEAYGQGRNFGHVAFRVEDIYEVCERLQKAGVTINRPPKDGRMAFVKSPDGISVELLQKGDPLVPQQPWVSMKNVGSW